MDYPFSAQTRRQHTHRSAAICGTFSDRIVARPEQLERLKRRAFLLTQNARIRNTELKHGEYALR